MSAIALRLPGFESDLKSKKLKDVATVKRGAGSQYITYSDNAGSSIRLIRIGDFLGSEPVHVLKTVAIERFILQHGDILIAGTGATAGIVFEIPDSFDGLAYSYNAPRIRPEGVESGYLINYLKSPNLEIQKRRLLTGNAQPFLDITDLKNLKFYLPSVAEQKKIADFLGAVDDKIAGLRERERLLIRYKKGVMQKIFTQDIRFKADDGSNFPVWTESEIGSQANLYQPQTISQTDLTNEGYTVYGANGVIGKYHSFNHEKEQVTVTCRGSTCGTIGWTQPNSWITGNAMVVNLDKSVNAIKRFFYYYLDFDDLRYLITGSGQPQITGDLKRHKVKMPHLEEQQKIADFLSVIDTKITTVSAQITQMQDFKKGLLQQMFV